jgi:hypothetical protein
MVEMMRYKYLVLVLLTMLAWAVETPKIDTKHLKDAAVTAPKINTSNSPSTGKVLKYVTDHMEWGDVTSTESTWAVSQTYNLTQDELQKIDSTQIDKLGWVYPPLTDAMQFPHFSAKGLGKTITYEFTPSYYDNCGWDSTIFYLYGRRSDVTEQDSGNDNFISLWRMDTKEWYNSVNANYPLYEGTGYETLVDGHKGMAAHIDGYNYPEQPYLSSAADEKFNLGTSSGWSISFWLRASMVHSTINHRLVEVLQTDAAHNETRIVSFTIGSNGPTYDYFLRVHVRGQLGLGDNCLAESPPGARMVFHPDTWYHILFTCSDVGNKHETVGLRLYVNGVLTCKCPLDAPPVYTPIGNPLVRIGYYGAPLSCIYDIDDLAIWRKTLPSGEVLPTRDGALFWGKLATLAPGIGTISNPDKSNTFGVVMSYGFTTNAEGFTIKMK